MYSKEHTLYLKRIKRTNILIHFTRMIIILTFLLLWEYLSRKNIINSFIYSSPSKILTTIKSLYNGNNLFNHIGITLYETIVSFLLTAILGLLISIVLWYSNFLYKVLDPYLTIINSLPKVALGPIIIIIFGANIKSIIIMSLLISLIVVLSNIYNGFINTDRNKIKLLKSFNANKTQILKYLIIPSNYNVIVSSLKINISMTLIGVIMGELLVSKRGIGYLINYGKEVFNLNMVFTGIFLLLIFSYLMYILIEFIEKLLIKEK